MKPATPVTHPDKQQVRQWMQQRQVERKPVPTLEEIRTLLGWRLFEAERANKEIR